MSEQHIFNPPIGWTCENCGGWTRTGSVHMCPIDHPPEALRPYMQPEPVEPMERIAAALERIADELAKARA